MQCLSVIVKRVLQHRSQTSIPDDIPPATATRSSPLAPLTDEEVAQAVARLPLRRAPGPDDWTGAEPRLWPGRPISALAALLRKVEELGRWPDGLWAAEVVLLLKTGGDPGQPLQKSDHPVTGDLPPVGQASAAPSGRLA